MLKNAYLVAKIGPDTAENERHFASPALVEALEQLLRGRHAALRERGGDLSEAGAGMKRRGN